jgi:integrase/recombinase XerC
MYPAQPTSQPPAQADEALLATCLSLWLGSLTTATRQSYGRAFTKFSRWMEKTQADTIRWLALAPQGEVTATLLKWRSAEQLTLAPASVNHGISVLRSVIRLLRQVGVTYNRIEIPALRVRPYRDTRGFGPEAIRHIWDAIGKSGPAIASRDRVLFWLLASTALRRSEICALLVSDFDAGAGTMMVRGKGNLQKEPVTIPRQAVQVVQDWLAVRSSLFVRHDFLLTTLDNAHRGAPLAPRGLNAIVERWGRVVDLPSITHLRPHAFRHWAITRALDLVGGDVRIVKRFSRHKSVEVVLVYDDNRTDSGGQVAQLLADQITLQVDNGS